MSTVFADISAALDGRLNIMPSLPPVSWENGGYNPEHDVLYLRVTNIPASTTQAGLGSQGIDLNAGIYQIDIYALSGNGKSDAITLSDAISDHFKRGTDLSYNSTEVRIGNVSRAVGQVVDDRYVITLSINYTAHTAPR